MPSQRHRRHQETIVVVGIKPIMLLKNITPSFQLEQARKQTDFNRVGRNNCVVKFTKWFLDGFRIGHERSVRTKRNIAMSFFARGVGILVSLMLIPLAIDYVNPTNYGIWVTMSSIVMWMNFFDIGLGHGLRNRFAQARALGDNVTAKKYVSTTYAVVSAIACLMFLVFCVINPILDWTIILNAPSTMRAELGILALVTFGMFCLQFVLRLISTILLAEQETAKSHWLTAVGSIVALIIIFVMSKATQGSLMNMCLALNGSQLVILFIGTFWYFSRNHKEFAPSLKYVEAKYIKNLTSLGIKFFFIQIAALLLYQTNNVIIAQLYGPEEVTVFYVAFRYFGIVSMVFGIVISPFWSAITEAYSKGEFAWIRNVMVKLRLFVVLLAVLTVSMLFASKPIFRLWLGNTILVPFHLSLCFSIYVIILAWVGIYSYFLNGVSRIKLQLYFGIGAAIVNVPLAIFLGKQIGIEGVVLANILVGIAGAIIYPIQYKKIINNDAKGIWNE